MIVEAVGRNDVLVRYRNSEGLRKESRLKDYLPHCYMSDEDAEWLEEGAVQKGYTGMFGESLSKVTCFSQWDVRQLAKTGTTWEGNVPFTNQVLTKRVKDGLKPFESYVHRVWYLDGEWKTGTGEITMLSVHDSFTGKLFSWVCSDDIPVGKHSTLTDNQGQSYTYETPIISFKNEHDLLSHFIGFMRKHDPDIITGWYVNGADINQIVKRCGKVNVRASLMSPLNKLRFDFGDWQQPIVGRNVIDLMLAFPKLYELKNGKLSGYKLDDVAWQALGERKVELPDGHDTYYSDPVKYLDYNRQDVRLLPRLNSMVNAIEYFIAVQHIAQCEIQSTPHITKVFTCLALSDPLLDRQLPSRPMFDKVDYDGGIVMEGETGFYENIGIFDVKAMYHSNAALHNISWDSLDPEGVDCGNGTCFSGKDKGLLVRQMDRMTELRDEYKGMMKAAKTDAETVRYDALQYATKSLVASMYGVAGDSKYGLYHPDIAAAITFTSRATLTKLKTVSEELGFPVVYGHTDSVMCRIPDVKSGVSGLDFINDAMSPIIVQFEKWSNSFLLMGKNRYAGLVSWTDGEHHEPKRYVKGIELKQNRMPTVMKNAMGRVIDGILKREEESVVTDELVALVDSIIGKEIDPLLLCMKGKLSKDLSQYNSVSGSAAGARWANRNLGKYYRKDDYFLCAIDPKGNYMAFDDPSELEGVGEIGHRTMVERFIIAKVKPYYEVAKWDLGPLLRAMDGKNKVQWI